MRAATGVTHPNTWKACGASCSRTRLPTTRWAQENRTRFANSWKKHSDYLDLDWKEYYVEDPRYLRPAEVDFLMSDCKQGSQRIGMEAPDQF